MKKLNKLFAILIAVLGVGSLSAQTWTDKTSLLVNPSFEGQTGATNLTSGWGAPSTGWTLTPSDAPANSQSGVAASSCTIQGIATTLPTTDGGNYFYVRTNWNNDVTFSLSQTVAGDLPAGLYRLTCKAASNSGNWAASKFSLTLKEDDSNISTNSSLNKCSNWTEWSIDLYKNEPSTSLTIEATMYPGSSGGSQHYQLLLDDFKLEYQSLDDIETTGWSAPQVPGSDIKSFVGTGIVAAMYNVGSDAFVTRGMTWGTQAIATKLHNSDSQTQATSDRHHVKISAGDGDLVRFSVNSKNYLGDGGQGSTTTIYTDNGNTAINQFSYSEQNEGTYRFKVGNATSDENAFLDVSQPYGGQLTYANGQGFTEWAIIKFSDIENGKYAQYKAKKAMYEVYKAVVDAGHSTTYKNALRTALETYAKPNATASDITVATNVLIKAVAPALTAGYVNVGALFTNPDMRGAGKKSDWTTGYTDASWGCFENWHGNRGANQLTQTQTQLPNGFYKIVYHGIWRQDGSDAGPVLTLSSNGKSASANVPCITDVAWGVGNTNGSNNWTTLNGKIVPNGMQSAGEAFSHGNAQATVSDFVVSNGELTIDVNTSSGSQWLLAQGFDIYFKAESLEEYANLFYDAKSAAEAIDQNTLNTYSKNQLSTALNNAATEQIKKEWYQEQTAALKSAVAIANDVATAYPKTSALLSICDEILNNSVEFEDGAKTTFSDVVTTANTNIATAQTSAAINEIYNNLETARQIYVVKADPINDIYFDYTFNIVNPSFETGNTDGWTTSSGGDTGAKLNSNGTYTIEGADGEFVFNTWGTDNMRVEQTLKNIPTGLYTAKVIVASDQNNIISLTAGNVTTDITITTNKSIATEGVVETSYSSGDFLIGASSATWFKADHFRLYYHGFDVPTAQNGVATLKAEAEALVGTPMNGTIATTLNSTIAGVDVNKTTRKELTSMIDALNDAIEAAKASIAEYEKIAQYIAKADIIHKSIAASYQNQYENGTIEGDANTVFQELEVATYNYVVDNFTYPVALSNTWNTSGTENTKAADFTGEHWSDNNEHTYKNQYDDWGDNKQGYPANSWKINFDQSVTLPEGEYVFKVAGRKSADTELRLEVTTGETVLGTVNDFPSTNEGMGINKAGAASFDVNDPAGFSKEGKGYGWQWRYVKFTLHDEATVKVAIYAQTDKQYNFVSFGDYTLQMTEDTYLKANMGGLDAPTAAANALVDTKPMGLAENNALEAALAMPVTTGAELLDKITALETAVANAEAWVAAYNDAKAPLVTALERFEADYNDAQNGALYYMCKERWATAIDMAKAAAVAKDATDSYDGFETATNNLVAALDAATVSVNEYSALDAAIKTAKPLYEGGNWGDQPFQRPTSAKESLNTENAQAVYNAATADGEGVTSVTEALNNGLNGIVLNAPAEGARYNMVMSYAGWEHDGKAVTYLAGGRNDAGLYNIQYYAAPNANYAQAFTFTAVEGKTNCYTLSMTDVDGNERYVCTGVPYGGNTSQLRTTTNAEDALVVEVIATATDGIHNLYNTEAKNYIGGQDAGFFTVNSHTTFRLQEAAKANVTLTLSKVGWATLILPFNAELPEGVKAYSCGEADGETLTLVEAESIKANTPYLMNGYESTYEFSGYGLADKDNYTEGLFVGTYTGYNTTNDGKTYVLQKRKEEADAAFYLVGENAQPTVGAYRCYMVYEGAAGAPKFSFGRGGDTTSIEGSELDAQGSVLIYDLMGRKVETMEKGGMYIVNGKKVVIK